MNIIGCLSVAGYAPQTTSNASPWFVNQIRELGVPLDAVNPDLRCSVFMHWVGQATVQSGGSGVVRTSGLGSQETVADMIIKSGDVILQDQVSWLLLEILSQRMIVQKSQPTQMFQVTVDGGKKFVVDWLVFTRDTQIVVNCTSPSYPLSMVNTDWTIRHVNSSCVEVDKSPFVSFSSNSCQGLVTSPSSNPLQYPNIPQFYLAKEGDDRTRIEIILQEEKPNSDLLEDENEELPGTRMISFNQTIVMVSTEWNESSPLIVNFEELPILQVFVMDGTNDALLDLEPPVSRAPLVEVDKKATMTIHSLNSDSAVSLLTPKRKERFLPASNVVELGNPPPSSSHPIKATNCLQPSECPRN